MRHSLLSIVWLMEVKDNMEVFKSLINQQVYKTVAVQISIVGKQNNNNTASGVIHGGINVDSGAVLVTLQKASSLLSVIRWIISGLKDKN